MTAARMAPAQKQKLVKTEGYVTAVDAATGFDVDGTHVTTSPETAYGRIDGKPDKDQAPLKDSLRVGLYVQVVGSMAGGSIRASSVLWSDNSGRKLHGFGVIDRVICPGSEPVYEADGYRMQIRASTQVSFRGSLKSLADVGTNTWVSYEGKRDKAGVLVTTEARFFSAKSGKSKAKQDQPDQVPTEDSLVSADGRLLPRHAKVRMSDSGGVCGWHKVPGDKALQERVHRIGMSVVPAYQKHLAADDASKIKFRFYAVNETKVRSDISCTEGVVLVPQQVVERLKNDDQLAAILADGVAYSLQLQAARNFWGKSGKTIEVASVAADAAFLVANPIGVLLANETFVKVASRLIETKLEEQRGRVTLALMANAGYDPWQAPEAWRLLAPKHLLTDTGSLKYPDRSGYMLGILGLQYAHEATPTGPQAARTENQSR